MQGMLRDIARKMDRSERRKAYNAVLRSISEIPSSVDPDGIELRASRIVGWLIQRHAVRLSKKAIDEGSGQRIFFGNSPIKGKTLDALEKEQNRKVKGEHGGGGGAFLLKVLEWFDAR